MRVSVILCTYSIDMYDHFVEAVESLYTQTYQDIEVIIVIDGNETLCKRVRATFGVKADTVIHCNEENRGLLQSRNIGVDHARGEVIAFIDDDAVAHEEWVEELVRAYRDRDAVAVGGKMDPRWVAGKPRYLPEEFYWLVGVTQRGFADGEGEVRNTFGSNLSFRREVFQELGGFNAAMGGRKGKGNLQGGESELCARLRETYGRGVWYRPHAKVEHKIFEYRTQLGWLVDRAFWQGYSKRAMEMTVAESDGTESEYLWKLLLTFAPGRIRSLVRRPSVIKLEQFVMLWVFTTAVGLGYLYGMIRLAGKELET